jgi:hypothetical protein
LESQGWEVYQEVEYRSGVADIVAVKSKRIWVVECKLTFSFASLKQAADWRKYADLVSVAVPHYSYNQPDGWVYGFHLAGKEGVGVLTVRPNRWTEYTIATSPGIAFVKEYHPSAEHAPPFADDFLGILKPQHKTFAKAGSPTGRRYTLFKDTAAATEAYVLAHPGCTLHEAAKGSAHHYKTPGRYVQNMKRLILRGVLKGVRLRHDPRSETHTLHPTEAATAIHPGPSQGAAPAAQPARPAQLPSLRSQLRAVPGRRGR